MGNICCQTQASPSPFQNGFNQSQYMFYKSQTLPANDNLLNQWLAQHNIQNFQNNIDPTFKTMKHSSKDRFYQGSWKDGVPEGKGLIYQPTKLLFAGNFHNGVPDGDSVINFIQQGCEYVGQLKEGKANGSGTISSTRDKFQFTGKWENSKPKNGILTFTADQNISYIQIQDFQNGKAKINYKDLRVYEGDINTNKLLPNGKGKVTFAYNSPKTSYEGHWHNGFMHGEGVFQWVDGSRYQGQFVHGRKQGLGTFTFPNGNYYKGYWVGGKQQGVGTLYDKNNQQIKKGTWVNGVFSKPLQKQQWENQTKISALRRSKILQQIQNQIKKQKQQQKLHKSGIKQRLSQAKSQIKDKAQYPGINSKLDTPSKLIQELNKSQEQPKPVVIQIKDTKQNPQYSSNLLIPNQNLNPPTVQYTSNLHPNQNEPPKTSQIEINSNLNNPPSAVQNAPFILDKNQNSNLNPAVIQSAAPGMNYTGSNIIPPTNQLGGTGTWHKDKSSPGIF